MRQNARRGRFTGRRDYLEWSRLKAEDWFRPSTIPRRGRVRLTRNPAKMRTAPRPINVTAPRGREPEPAALDIPSRAADKIAAPAASRKTPKKVMSNQSGLLPRGARRYRNQFSLSDRSSVADDESSRFTLTPSDYSRHHLLSARFRREHSDHLPLGPYQHILTSAPIVNQIDARTIVARSTFLHRDALKSRPEASREHGAVCFLARKICPGDDLRQATRCREIPACVE